jgi:hypothetical protein
MINSFKKQHIDKSILISCNYTNTKVIFKDLGKELSYTVTIII